MRRSHSVRWMRAAAPAVEAPATQMGQFLEELAQSAFNKTLDELTWQELKQLQDALSEQVGQQPGVHVIDEPVDLP